MKKVDRGKVILLVALCVAGIGLSLWFSKSPAPVKAPEPEIAVPSVSPGMPLWDSNAHPLPIEISYKEEKVIIKPIDRDCNVIGVVPCGGRIQIKSLSRLSSDERKAISLKLEKCYSKQAEMGWKPKNIRYHLYPSQAHFSSPIKEEDRTIIKVFVVVVE